MARPLVIQPPIIVDDFGDVQVFARVEDAERELELADVGRVDLGVYDSLGRALVLKDASRWFSERVEIAGPESDAPPPDALRIRLRRYLSALGDDSTDSDNASIATLAARALALQSRKT